MKKKKIHGLKEERTIEHFLSVLKPSKLSNNLAIYLMEMGKLLIMF